MQSKIHFNQVELARRWCLSPKTLERWRWEGIGPRYLKVGGRVLYRVAEIEAFEVSRECASTMDEKPMPGLGGQG